jgi:hypothetical protein
MLTYLNEQAYLANTLVVVDTLWHTSAAVRTLCTAGFWGIQLKEVSGV